MESVGEYTWGLAMAVAAFRFRQFTMAASSSFFCKRACDGR